MAFPSRTPTGMSLRVVEGTTDDMTTDGMYRHPWIPIKHAFPQVKAVRRLRLLRTGEGTRKGTRRWGSPAVLAQALRSSGCPLRTVGDAQLVPLTDISSYIAWRRPHLGPRAYARRLWNLHVSLWWPFGG